MIDLHLAVLLQKPANMDCSSVNSFQLKEPLQEVSRNQAMMLQQLSQLAAKYAGQGSGSFYGCPRCSWMRTWCISWRCNPEKYQAHRSKFPQKYNDQVLKPEEEAKNSKEEFDGLESLNKLQEVSEELKHEHSNQKPSEMKKINIQKCIYAQICTYVHSCINV